MAKVEYQANIEKSEKPAPDSEYILSITETHKPELNERTRPLRVNLDKTYYPSAGKLLKYINHESFEQKAFSRATIIELLGGMTTFVTGYIAGVWFQEPTVIAVYSFIGGLSICRATWNLKKLDLLTDRVNAINKERQATYSRVVIEEFKSKPQEEVNQNPSMGMAKT